MALLIICPHCKWDGEMRLRRVHLNDYSPAARGWDVMTCPLWFDCGGCGLGSPLWTYRTIARVGLAHLFDSETLGRIDIADQRIGHITQDHHEEIENAR